MTVGTVALEKPRHHRYTIDQMITVLTETKGLVATAARRIGCSETTVRAFAHKHEAVAEVLKAQREQMTDIAELSLYEAIRRGEGWAICFYLKTQGKNRGYIERQEHDHTSGGQPFQLAHENLDAAIELRLAIMVSRSEGTYELAPPRATESTDT